MFRTVVVPLDGSELATHALPFARRVARDWGGRLILVRAQPEHSADASSNQVQGELDALVGQLALEGIAAEARVIQFPPAPGIARMAEEAGVELIVMASHQRHGLDRWFNGSVTESVLRQSRVPLLVVPLEVASIPGESELFDPIRIGRHWIGRAPTRMLVPLDGSEQGEAALALVAEIGADHPLNITLLRVITPAAGMMILGDFYTALPQADLAAREYLKSREDELRQRGIPVQSRIIESVGPVAPAIVEAARGGAMDAIAMATHGRGAVVSHALGSTALDVLETTPVPLLLVHRKGANRAAPPAQSPDADLANTLASRER